MVANALGIALDDPASGSVVLQETSFNQTHLLADLRKNQAFGSDVSTRLWTGNHWQCHRFDFAFSLSQSQTRPKRKGLLDRMAEERLEASANVSTEQEAITPQLLND